MASTINTTNIDTTYPIAGQDNDSQGFRDNFTNINTNFVAAKDEIEDLQNKAVLKSALTGGSLDNDMAGALISNAQIQGFRGTVVNLGSVSGAVGIDVSGGPYHKLTTTGSVTFSFTNFPAAGTHSSVEVEVQVASTAHTLTLPAEVTIGVSGIQEISSNVITFQAGGTYIFQFGTSDQGASISVNDLTQARIASRQNLVSAPASSIGAAGDLPGMIAYDSSYMYLCTQAYDGVTNIWIRSSAATW